MPMRYLRYSRRSTPAGLPATGWTILRLGLTLAGTALALSVVVFVLTAAPADPARAYLGTSASPAQLAIFRHTYGLDHSLARRYLDWLGGLLHGNLGVAYGSNTPVWSLVAPRLDRSLPLVAIAWVLMVAGGVP